MAHVGLEAVLGIEGAHQRADRGRLKLDDRAAGAADQVHVLGVGGQVIAVRAVPEMGVGDQPDLLEQLQGPVNGGKVESDSRLLDLGVYLLRGGVLEPGDCLEDELALRCHPVPAGPQRVIPRPRHALSLVTAR